MDNQPSQEQKPKSKLKRLGKRVLAVIVGLVALFVILIIVAVATDNKNSNSNSAGSENNNASSVEMTYESKLEKAITDEIGAKNNMDKPKVRSVKVMNPNETLVEINGDENLTSGMTKKGIDKDILNTFKAIFATDTNPNLLASVDVYFPTVDKYGNESDNRVIRALLKRETANKIQWDNILLENIPAVFDDYDEYVKFE
ncbi:hypothetical protein C4546_05115 [Candidatus Parcubacteria bacterium]|jgi:3-oxoacyl-[acyl-carrier-protein] synthase III|nr:MAG: hypothetical protein C4546_05115 [Candidatus Parcubacteria bacterium]